jgi:tRNA(Arg) A34 adenosine deaminase TadA
MMAIMLAQKKLNTHDFSRKGQLQLVTSSKMCIMCMGAVIWSGLCEVVCSAMPSDVQ